MPQQSAEELAFVATDRQVSERWDGTDAGRMQSTGQGWVNLFVVPYGLFAWLIWSWS